MALIFLHMNKRQTLLVPFFLLLFSQIVLAHTIYGTIKDDKDDPIPYATIYVEETGTGVTTNDEGKYRVALGPGNYTLIFQHLGYQAERREITLGSEEQEINMVLKEQAFQLKTVDVIGNTDEDPAYTIMRKAIAKSSYHRQQIETYTAQVYIKGAGRIKKIPFYLRRAMKKEGIDTSFAFVQESVSKVEYKRPNTFNETVISIYTQGEANSSSPNAYINGSFYEPEIAEAISPLSPKAFAYYRFELEGYFVDRDYGINQIRVIPRSRGENLFEGTIYIVEDWWSIHSLALKTYKFGFAFNISQVYAPIQDKAWLPVSHKFGVDGSILGIGLTYNYLATVKDYTIELNPDLDVDFRVIDEKIEKELAKELAAAKKKNQKTGTIKERLSKGEELTRKDLRKMIRDYEKQERKERKEPEVVMERTYKVDSMAKKRDASYWEEIRPVPLTNYEVKGYVMMDSLERKEQAENQKDSTAMIGGNRKRKRGGFQVEDIIMGSSYKLGKKQRLSYETPLVGIRFNPVEGYSVKTDLAYRVWNDKTRSRITLTPRYSFARNKLSLKGQYNLNYGPRLRRSAFGVEGGRYISQYNPAKPISEAINTFSTLLYEQNFIRLYEKEYASIGLNHKFKGDVDFRAGVAFENRHLLFNNTNQTWFNRDDRIYDDNVPINEEVSYPFPNQEKAFHFRIGVKARPWQKYRIYNGKKQRLDNSTPQLSLQYRGGLPGILDSDADFGLIEAGFEHDFKVGAGSHVHLQVNAGAFLYNDYVGFADYKHFAGNRTVLATINPAGSFRLLDYYRHSTKEEFVATQLHYQFRKFLVTRIPEVWLLGIKENIFVNHLYTPTSQQYFEVGYSIDNIFRIFRIEAATAFQNGKYFDFGIRIGIASNIGNIEFD